MGDLAPITTDSPITLDGMEVLFTTSSSNLQEGVEVIQEGSQEDLLPIAKAAGILGVHRRYALDLVKKGKLTGSQNSKGQWFVTRKSVEERAQISATTLQEVLLEDAQEGVEVNLEDPPSRPSEIARLIDLVEKQAAKLESAAGQIGYLKSQLEERERETDTYKEQIKLLTDSQGSHRRWWHRFMSYFGASDR